MGDERRLKQVMLNLVKNAVKFTQKGSIDISASYDIKTNNLNVHVKDSGAGIDSEDFSKLFSRFGKLHRTAKLNNEGIGLGLTIVKEIVEKCGGSIGVKSEGINRGSLFYFNMNMEVCED